MSSIKLKKMKKILIIYTNAVVSTRLKAENNHKNGLFLEKITKKRSKNHFIIPEL